MHIQLQNNYLSSEINLCWISLFQLWVYAWWINRLWALLFTSQHNYFNFVDAAQPGTCEYTVYY